MIEFFKTIIYEPLYNLLVALIDVMPGGDVALAIILLTLIVRVLLTPLFSKSIKMQAAMEKIKPELAALQEKHKNDKAQLGQKSLELYRSHKINPLTTFFVLLLQIPVFVSLYYMFAQGGLPTLDTASLYSFTPRPQTVDMHLLGLLDVSERSIILAALAGISQYLQIRFSPAGKPMPKSDKPSFKDDLARSMNLNLRFGMPLLIGVVAYALASAVALYWITNSLVTIAQELLIRRRLMKTNAS